MLLVCNVMLEKDDFDAHFSGFITYPKKNPMKKQFQCILKVFGDINTFSKITWSCKHENVCVHMFIKLGHGDEKISKMNKDREHPKRRK